ncbi:MAG: gliding-motility protein MglA [Deltaproteobacteria bacterium]|nr:gliding-motility protein MglA [Deltaproteobacteria bacterium]
MAFTNQETKEVHCKILYCGPAGAGKRENLRSVYRENADEIRSGMMQLESGQQVFRYFDFLPVSLGHVCGYHLKLHLFTLPSSCLFSSVLEIILRGVDGLIFIADSQVSSLAPNIESFREIRALLEEHRYQMDHMPLVLQYNKRDLDDIVPVDVLRQELNLGQFPDFEAIASRSMGTLETLQSMARQVLMKMAS